MNLDPALVERAVTPRTRAILPVHLFGRPCDMGGHPGPGRAGTGSRWWRTAPRASGARLPGPAHRHPGPDAGCFSFFPSKNLGGCGDGGLLATDDDGLADLARALRAHGSRRKYHNEMVGYNSRLDELQAALLRVKLPHLEAWNAGRRRVAADLPAAAGGPRPGILAPALAEGHVFHQYTVRVPGCDRDRAPGPAGRGGGRDHGLLPGPLPPAEGLRHSHAHVSCPGPSGSAPRSSACPSGRRWRRTDQAAVARALLAGGHRESARSIPGGRLHGLPPEGAAGRRRHRRGPGPAGPGLAGPDPAVHARPISASWWSTCPSCPSW